MVISIKTLEFFTVPGFVLIVFNTKETSLNSVVPKIYIIFITLPVSDVQRSQCLVFSKSFTDILDSIISDVTVVET